MRLKIKIGSHRYDIKRPRSRHGHKYTKYKMCFSIVIVICIKQHLSNIWSWIHEKVKQHWGWVKKKALLTKKTCKTAWRFAFLYNLRNIPAV